MNRETIGIVFVIALFVFFIALAIPYVYFLAARGWYWGGPAEMILLLFFIGCLLVGAIVGAASGHEE